MTQSATRSRPPETKAEPKKRPRRAFVPVEPKSLAEASLTDVDVEALVMRYLLNVSVATSRQIAQQVCLPLALTQELLRQYKADQLIAYRRSSGLDDYEHELTPNGFERAERYLKRCTYFGAAPVSLADYCAAVKAQSPMTQRPTADDLKEALKDLQVTPDIFNKLGQALASVAGVFLYGKPGNGKTSIAERLTKAFGPFIWIPRAVHVDGEVMRVFDPTVHEELPLPDNTNAAQRVDRRWALIKRPTIMVGGELTLEHLEIRPSKTARGVVESPVQLKSNCGTLVIDDFGRQRVSTTELLNRWIVPLEKRFDFLNTPGGKKIQVPFEQLIVFATNLEPEELVDEAFLRRIPYKIEALDPTETEFRKLFHLLAGRDGVALEDDALDYLISHHFTAVHREFRYCQVRDILNQVKNFCTFFEKPLTMNRESIDAAVQNYFAAM